jgi:hypothetical protein
MRVTAAGQAYLDLQNRARAEGRGTQELLTLYVAERWLARLAASPYADQFVIKGGMLLAAYDARRPTADLDALARAISNDEAAVRQLIIEIALQPSEDDGVEYQADTAISRVIRDQAIYAGVRIAMDCAIATAVVKFRLDINFGDPITPAPGRLVLPSLRPGIRPVQVLGYPIETILAEKIATAIALGPANTRVRDYADIYTLTGNHPIAHGTAREAVLATTAFRGIALAPLSSVLDNFVELRRQTYAAYRAGLGTAGENLPTDLSLVVAAVIAFADDLVTAQEGATWSPTQRHWTRTADSQGQQLPS